MGRNETINDAPILCEAYLAYKKQRREHESLADHHRFSLSQGPQRIIM